MVSLFTGCSSGNETNSKQNHVEQTTKKSEKQEVEDIGNDVNKGKEISSVYPEVKFQNGVPMNGIFVLTKEEMIQNVISSKSISELTLNFCESEMIFKTEIIDNKYKTNKVKYQVFDIVFEDPMNDGSNRIRITGRNDVDKEQKDFYVDLVNKTVEREANLYKKANPLTQYDKLELKSGECDLTENILFEANIYNSFEMGSISQLEIKIVDDGKIWVNKSDWTRINSGNFDPVDKDGVQREQTILFAPELGKVNWKTTKGEVLIKCDALKERALNGKGGTLKINFDKKMISYDGFGFGSWGFGIRNDGWSYNRDDNNFYKVNPFLKKEFFGGR